MANRNNFKLPVFIIKKTKPLLKKDEMVFAYEFTLTTEDGKLFKAYENKGIDLSNYVNEKVACLLEITKGQFRYKDENGNKPENVATFQYLWLKRPYEFFPELSKIYDHAQNSDLAEQDSKRASFETTASEFLKNWGLNGVSLEVYQTKPLLNSEYGIFLLNEYEFEKELDRLELNQEIYIEIEELYLRGIRPLDEQSLIKWKQLREQEKNSPPQPEPEQPQPEVKKKRTFFT